MIHPKECYECGRTAQAYGARDGKNVPLCGKCIADFLPAPPLKEAPPNFGKVSVKKADGMRLMVLCDTGLRETLAAAGLEAFRFDSRHDEQDGIVELRIKVREVK